MRLEKTVNIFDRAVEFIQVQRNKLQEERGSLVAVAHDVVRQCHQELDMLQTVLSDAEAVPSDRNGRRKIRANYRYLNNGHQQECE